MSAGSTSVPGPKPSVSPEQIVAAALAEGISSFTLTSISRRIGLSHSGIYRYFADRDALLNACIDEVASEILWPTHADDWRELLRDYATALWDGFRRYPGSADALMKATAFPRRVVEAVEVLSQLLQEWGFSATDAVLALDLIGDQVWLSVLGYEKVSETTDDGRTRADRFEASWSTPASPSETEEAPPITPWYGKELLLQKVEIILDGFEPRRQ